MLFQRYYECALRRFTSTSYLHHLYKRNHTTSQTSLVSKQKITYNHPPTKRNGRSFRWFSLIFLGGSAYFLLATDKRRRALIDEKANLITEYVYMDIAKGDRYLGRLLIGVFGNTVPMTVNNFIQLASGYPVKNKIIGYRNCLIHTIIPGKLLLSGDVITGKGSDSLSIYGPMFPDENFSQSFIRKGDVAMFSRKPNGNGSSFMITLRPFTEGNGKFVVFGTLVKGYEILSILASDVNPERGAVDYARSSEPAKIISCGVYKDKSQGPPYFVADREQIIERKLSYTTGHAFEPVSDIWQSSQLALTAAKKDLETKGKQSEKILTELQVKLRPFIRDRRHDQFIQASTEERNKLVATVHKKPKTGTDQSYIRRQNYLRQKELILKQSETQIKDI